MHASSCITNLLSPYQWTVSFSLFRSVIVCVYLKKIIRYAVCAGEKQVFLFFFNRKTKLHKTKG